MINLLRKTRRERELTMTSLAITASVPIASLSRIEAGARCSQHTAKKLADVLHVGVRDLFPEYSSLRP
jgi:DNA-binding XRE family transcriptional regulator